MRIQRLLMYLFRVFPVRNKVFFSSFEGRFIACNPKYIYKYLKNRCGNQIKYVWEYNGEKRDGINTVKHNSLRYMYHIMTSRVIVTNTGISAVFPLRKNQTCINTWHGSGAYKKVGKDIDSKINGSSEKRMELTNRSTSYFVSGCKKFTEVMSGAIGLSINKFLPIGMPRNDFLVRGDGYDLLEIKKKIGIDRDVKTVLYAPTFRGATGAVNSFDCKISVDSLLKMFSQKFGGNWVFAYRCHYHMKSDYNGIADSVDLSNYEDMQELLAVSDALITDYSSSIWDYSFTAKPCFLFCYDLQNYKSERDFYVPIEDWGFPIAENNDELMLSVAEFSYDKYLENMTKHHIELGSYENGTATEKICALICERLNIKG